MNHHPMQTGWLRGSAEACEPDGGLRDHAYRLILLGPPGVGKGTQAELLSAQLRTCHLSTGDVFRAATCDGHPSAAVSAALAAMSRGELVSDELVIETVRERSGCLQCKGGFLLDGFPRTLQQAQWLQSLLEEMGVALDGVVSYEMALDEIVERIGGRRTCTDCKAVYHETARPPAQAGICDRCGGALRQRDDDRREVVRIRMDAYRRATEPLGEYYSQRNELISIPAGGEPGEILAQTLAALHARRDQRERAVEKCPSGEA